MRQESRGPWYLLTGLVIGVFLGLAYAWLVDPLEYVDTHPATLRMDFKDQYRAMIAAAFVANGDLARAQARLNLFEEEDSARVITMQAQRALAEGRPENEVQALGLLAMSLSQGAVSFTPGFSAPRPTGTPSALPGAQPGGTPTASATLPPAAEPNPAVTLPSTGSAETSGGSEPASSGRTPTPTWTALPTRTPTPTTGAPYILDSKTQVCSEDYPEPLLMIEVRDAAGAAVAGVEVVVIWTGGEEHFFTGLKSDLNPGYADFEMTAGVTYTAQLKGGGEPVSGLTPFECETPSGERVLGSWQLIFTQP